MILRKYIVCIMCLSYIGIWQAFILQNALLASIKEFVFSRLFYLFDGCSHLFLCHTWLFYARSQKIMFDKLNIQYYFSFMNCYSLPTLWWRSNSHTWSCLSRGTVHFPPCDIPSKVRFLPEKFVQVSESNKLILTAVASNSDSRIISHVSHNPFSINFRFKLRRDKAGETFPLYFHSHGSNSKDLTHSYYNEVVL